MTGTAWWFSTAVGTCAGILACGPLIESRGGKLRFTRDAMLAVTALAALMLLTAVAVVAFNIVDW